MSKPNTPRQRASSLDKPRLPNLRTGGLALLFMGLSLLLSACVFDGPQSTFDTVAPVGEKQMWLLGYTTVISLFVMAGVIGVLFYALWKYRAKEGDDSIPAQTHGNTLVEVSLIALAVVITVIVIVPAVRINFETGVHVTPTEDDVIVNVTGYQWWWAMEYPEEGIVTANEIHIPQGDYKLILNLASADVLHSFWMPKLGGKMDLIPNQDNQLWLQIEADTPTGVYYGECAELCLGAHAYMRMRVIIDTPEAYQAWLESFQSIQPLAPRTADAPSPPSQPQFLQVQDIQLDADLVTTGEGLFKTKGCGACHAVKGYSGGAIDKPDLTNFGLRHSLAAGVLDMPFEGADAADVRRANLIRWLRNPQEVKPGNYMPTLWSEDDPLRDEQIAAITEYLLSLGVTGETVPQANNPSTLIGGTNGN